METRSQTKAEKASSRSSTPQSTESDEIDMDGTVVASTELEKSLQKMVLDLTERIKILESRPIPTLQSSTSSNVEFAIATSTYTTNSSSDNLPSQIAQMPRSTPLSTCNSLKSGATASYAQRPAVPLQSPHLNFLPTTTWNLPFLPSIPMSATITTTYARPNVMPIAASTQFPFNQGTNMGASYSTVPQLSTPRKLYDLPEFNGRPEDWPIFLTSLNESTAAYGYSMLENTLRLQPKPQCSHCLPQCHVHNRSKYLP
ncbi:uncharacterized protein LOC118757133 [Rhagoletis pomonella]|uniref:uncharacterized protein LOC118757133 n=1 Tax=Rhagoletis pomonella TaxID=28610 RepID=UPI00177F4B0C|nr:uncharacterized protein LOC118757133 [Rhagoletis pomonella]